MLLRPLHRGAEGLLRVFAESNDNTRTTQSHAVLEACVQGVMRLYEISCGGSDGEIIVDLDAVMQGMEGLLNNSSTGSFTVNEVSTFLRGTSYGDFAKWLLADRHRNFKIHDVAGVSVCSV